MTIARAFTKRLGRSDSNATLSRADSIRKEISSPITLLSTTNMISYEAPDVAVARMAMRHAASAMSPDFSRKSSESDQNLPGTPMTEPSLTDGSSIESSPTLEYNHLSDYFPGPTKGATSARTIAAANAPAVPRRAISHSKREHVRLARQRSVSRGSRDTSPAPRSPARTSFDIMGLGNVSATEAAPTSQTSPFSHELEQLSEVAEEFQGVARDIEAEEDAKHMKRMGLCFFSVDDYTTEIGSLWPSSLFEAGLQHQDYASGWL